MVQTRGRTKPVVDRRVREHAGAWLSDAVQFDDRQRYINDNFNRTKHILENNVEKSKNAQKDAMNIIVGKATTRVLRSQITYSR